MADITGKIYQMKNADGTENRFPRTVIEAVLGLSSYLQDQFSSLADIYMPIEGIYEALTGQEFVFRKSPNTIKAKSLTIDRIKGKTIVVDDQLASNDAEAVETTGVNQWDEEWELGIYSNGVKASATDRIRCKNPIPCFPSTIYKITVVGEKSNTTFQLNFLDDDGNFISGLQVTNDTFETPNNCHYFVFFTLTSYYGTTYNHNVCINLSDPAINGQYFPYWKRTLQLGLNSFKVKDAQGNVITITGGLKSAGGVYDEIVGNKYIRYVSTRAYQSGDESNTSVTTDGHEYTNYPLATPIEYDLVEHLIYTMKAGTTEERISPNSDGLSAPFCCDMTYSANENNDAGNAQYAATAGRLLNTHKIWGQDFNGSEDVNGNLVSNGILQGTQLKSTVPTGTAPLVVSSTTTVANLVAEKASQLLTARTIWGQNFDGSGDISGAISNITTISASALATLAGGIALGTSTKAQAAKMVWDETNEAWHLQGNLYADGFLTAGGINNGNDTATLIFGQNLSSSGETFSISAGLYDAPNDEYFTVPSSDSAQELDTGHILATKADIDTINARIQLIVDNNALFEPTE